MRALGWRAAALEGSNLMVAIGAGAVALGWLIGAMFLPDRSEPEEAMSPETGVGAPAPQVAPDTDPARGFHVPSLAELGLIEEGEPDDSVGQTITRVLDASEKLALAQGLVQEAAWKLATPMFAEAVKLNPANKKNVALLCLEEGRRFHEGGDVENAGTAFGIAVKNDPRNAGAHAFLAQCLVRRGCFEEATEHFLEVCALAPSAHRGFFNLGVFYDKVDRAGDAIHAFERVLELKPGALDAHFYLARLHAAAGRSAEAREHLERLVELGPNTNQGEWARSRLEASG